MSGIIVVVRTDGAPVEPAEVTCLMASLDLHGPDRRSTWSKGPIGFGHTLLRTNADSDRDQQPFSLDGQTWIVADARVDARSDLVRELSQDGEVRANASDAELLLRAYHRWGDACVEHLLGDFVFAIWDAAKQQLFGSRDHMGIKPFYYAHVDPWLVISNALDCVRRHPAVSDRLNDLAIADFLLFGLNQDRATTSFRDIQRLPPAHRLIWSGAGLSVGRYWSLPVEEPIYFRNAGDYVDRFRTLLRDAVADRLRTGRVGIQMSGGLDSPALAATASELLGRGTRPPPVRAFTFVYDGLIPDNERLYAGTVARHLGVPIEFVPLDSTHVWTSGVAMHTPEPTGMRTDDGHDGGRFAAMAAHSRLAFHGEGPDNALWYEWRPYLLYLASTRRWKRLAADVVNHLVAHKRVPLVPTIPRMLKTRLTRHRYDREFPAWIAPDLVARLGLKDRWRDLNQPPRSPHVVRPEAYLSLLDPRWQAIFETFTPAYTRVALEVRHPYLDLRLLRYMLRLPVLPWCRAKYLLRCALHGVIPEAVRRRPKTPLTGDPDYEEIRRHGLPTAPRSAALDAYGDVDKLPAAVPTAIPAALANLRLVALGYWLRDLRLPRALPVVEDVHDRSKRLAGSRQR